MKRFRPPTQGELAIGRAQDLALAQPDRARSPAPTERVHFQAWQRTLTTARSGRELLDRMLSPADGPRLVPMLPVEDLHRAIRRIGLEDSIELLAMASTEQVRGLLDLESWQGDELQLERVDAWLQALMEAGADVLARSVLALDDEFITWIVRRSVHAYVIEEPDDFDPPDGEYVLTPDGRMCISFPDPGERDLPVKILLDWLMRVHPVYCVDLLLGAESALDSTLQEEAWRWRSGRMADRGYVDPFDALAIYAPPPPAAVTPDTVVEPGSVPLHWLAGVVDPEARLVAAMGTLEGDTQLRVEQQLGYAANMAMSADRVEAWDLEAQKVTLRRLRAGLVLGLDGLGGATARADGQLMVERGPAYIFRAGYARMMAAAEPLRRREVRRLLRIGDDAVGAMDAPTWRLWAEALLVRHPGPPDDAGVIEPKRLGEVAAWARMLAALARMATDRPEEVGIGAYLSTGLARHLVGLSGFGGLPADQLEAAHRALFAEGALRPEARAAAERWWASLYGEPTALALLLTALTQQAAASDPAALDLSVVPWLVVEI